MTITEPAKPAKQRKAERPFIPAAIRIKRYPTYEIWERTITSFEVPRDFRDLTPDVRTHVKRLRKGLIRGYCPCGGEPQLTFTGIVYRHASECPAVDPELAARYAQFLEGLESK